MLRNIAIIFAVIIKVFNTIPCLAQNDDLTLTINEQFSNNQEKWALVNNATTKTEIRDNAYYFSYHSSAWWNTKVPLPSIIQNAFNANVVNLSFDLTFPLPSITKTSGVGLVFDKQGDNYNILYIGKESRNTFAAVIPRRNKQFLKAIKDGSTDLLSQSNTVRVTIKKKMESFSVYLDDIQVLTFVHETSLMPVDLHFTAGDYSIRNLNLYELRKGTVTVSDDEKKFDPSKFKTYALLVGVSIYESNAFSKLNSSINDIDSVRAFLTSPYGGSVPKENIKYLPGTQAKHDHVLFELKKLAAKATSNDLLMVFMSGHGFASSFYCYDGPLAYEEINRVLSTSFAKNKLVIVDACQSGFLKPVISPPNKDNSTQNYLENSFRFKLSMASNNTNYFTSCDEKESSFDGTKTTNSVFTSALIRATRDKSLGASGKILTIADVYKSVTRYFNVWNEKNSKVRNDVVVNYNGVLDNSRISKHMTPRLMPTTTINNLPFAILP
ncbi:caspase family protein [Dyadobacter sp. CY356]|uniref:caspase family protein n=1 Tax=Dyadobacter sp. CY356 TaxID=2906442 RepID=UPI001F3E6C46|nr:caspase family protein [Dyadobacter sp. CY356]MCF0055365.1 caspase family protein [Dyadobacter sp. CY356]